MSIVSLLVPLAKRSMCVMRAKSSSVFSSSAYFSSRLTDSSSRCLSVILGFSNSCLMRSSMALSSACSVDSRFFVETICSTGKVMVVIVMLLSVLFLEEVMVAPSSLGQSICRSSIGELISNSASLALVITSLAFVWSSHLIGFSTSFTTNARKKSALVFTTKSILSMSPRLLISIFGVLVSLRLTTTS